MLSAIPTQAFIGYAPYLAGRTNEFLLGYEAIYLTTSTQQPHVKCDDSTYRAIKELDKARTLIAFTTNVPEDKYEVPTVIEAQVFELPEMFKLSGIRTRELAGNPDIVVLDGAIRRNYAVPEATPEFLELLGMDELKISLILSKGQFAELQSQFDGMAGGPYALDAIMVKLGPDAKFEHKDNQELRTADRGLSHSATGQLTGGIPLSPGTELLVGDFRLREMYTQDAKGLIVSNKPGSRAPTVPQG